MTKIVLFENIHPSASEVFHSAGFTNIKTFPSALVGEELLNEVQDATVIGIRSRTQLEEKVLEHAKAARVVGCFCIGTNQVDLDYAMQKGLPVFNAPFSNTRSVAELVIAEAILLLRRIPEKNTRVHAGYWDKTAQGAFEARGKTLGIIGYGNIGSQVGTLAESMGMSVSFYDVEAKLPLGNAKSCASLAQLLADSDVVTLHVPGGAETENIINERTLGQMKKGAIVINASRGTVVDIEALNAALESDHISGAALDVFPVEPKSVEEPLDSPLKGKSNVILTPHIGGSTQESQENIGREVAEKIVSYLQHGATKSAVNFPEISYLPSTGAQRIIHVHKNVPGTMAGLSNVLAEHGFNISGQQLQTRSEFGYALTDVDKPITEPVLEALRALPGTLRCETLPV